MTEGATETSFGFLDDTLLVMVLTRKDAWDIQMFKPVNLKALGDVKTDIAILRARILMIV